MRLFFGVFFAVLWGLKKNIIELSKHLKKKRDVFFLDMDDKMDCEPQCEQFPKDLFWKAIDDENKEYLRKTVYNCCYNEYKLLAGIVVDGPLSVAASYKPCSSFPHPIMQTGWNLVSILELCKCCDFIIYYVNNPHIGLEMLRAIQQFVAENKGTLFARHLSLFDGASKSLGKEVARKLKQIYQTGCDQYFKSFPDTMDFGEHQQKFKARKI